MVIGLGRRSNMQALRWPWATEAETFEYVLLQSNILLSNADTQIFTLVVTIMYIQVVQAAQTTGVRM